MKILNTLALLCLCLQIGSSQTNVELNIYHFLGEEPFAFEMGAKNNIDNDFNVTRLQYYIDGITLLHDGGQETLIEEFWILADGGESVKAELGSLPIENLEGISFYIGVGPDYNHLDPAQYAPGHPLAYTAPSMHWGWISGYRFIAIEGFGSSDYNQMYQLHGLGDDNYFKTVIDYPATAENGNLAIHLAGDYTRVLENMPVNSGLIVHGETGEAKQALENMRDFVFSPTTEPEPSRVNDITADWNLQLSPNPSPTGQFQVSWNADRANIQAVQVFDMLGRLVWSQDSQLESGQINLQIAENGTYSVQLLDEAGHSFSKLVVVQQ